MSRPPGEAHALLSIVHNSSGKWRLKNQKCVKHPVIIVVKLMACPIYQTWEILFFDTTILLLLLISAAISLTLLLIWQLNTHILFYGILLPKHDNYLINLYKTANKVAVSYVYFCTFCMFIIMLLIFLQETNNNQVLYI